MSEYKVISTISVDGRKLYVTDELPVDKTTILNLVGKEELQDILMKFYGKVFNTRENDCYVNKSIETCLKIIRDGNFLKFRDEVCCTEIYCEHFELKNHKTHFMGLRVADMSLMKQTVWMY